MKKHRAHCVGYGARYGHAMVSCGGGAHVLGGLAITGGQANYFNDIQSLTYNASLGVDQWIATTALAPWPARHHFGVTALPDDTVLLTSGSAGLLNVNDMWINKQCVNSSTWQPLSSAYFPGRQSFRLVHFNGAVVLLGGLIISPNDGSQTDTSEVFSLAYNMNTRTFASNWTAYGSAPWLGRRDFAAVVYSESIYIFSGYQKNNPKYLNDVWTLSSLGTQWLQLSAQDSVGRFSPRAGSVAGVWKGLIIFTTGGNVTEAGQVKTQEVWSYSSITQQWTLINATSPLLQRGDAAMVNHQGRLIITGGNGLSALSDMKVSEYEVAPPATSSSSSSSSSASSTSSSSSTASSSSSSSSSTAQSSTSQSSSSSSSTASSSTSTAPSSSSSGASSTTDSSTASGSSSNSGGNSSGTDASSNVSSSGSSSTSSSALSSSSSSSTASNINSTSSSSSGTVGDVNSSMRLLPDASALLLLLFLFIGTVMTFP